MISLNLIIQSYVAILSPLAVYLLSRGKRKLAGVVGLAGQAGWFAVCLINHQWPLLIPAVAFTLIWVNVLRSK